ncbi:MAG: DEAD/DEAH box helicase family protein, partial [Prevotella sp.]|nr:DEAD/DEAH box helicase family protein [Prevotella sp.]
MFSLHDYQNDIKSRLAEAWREHRSVMVQMPTGTGKTHVLAAVVRDFLADVEDGVVWIVAHRRE